MRPAIDRRHFEQLARERRSAKLRALPRRLRRVSDRCCRYEWEEGRGDRSAVLYKTTISLPNRRPPIHDLLF